ncbi:MAG: hypothetical protein HKN04_14990 [Rhodothermaceae bacterium]|nr:hypothetical protein [Rhodothermaceae bacterium]
MTAPVMLRLVSLLSLLSVVAVVLGAGCAPKPMDTADAESETPGPMGDRVEIIGDPVAMPDLVRDGEVALDGAAAWDALSVAEWMQMAATTPVEMDAAERMISSGAYLGDPLPIVQMQPGEEAGTARYTTGQSVGDAFETEFLHRFADGGGRLDFIFSGPGAGGGRAMPSELRVRFSLGQPGLTNHVIAFLGDGSGPMSELARIELPEDLSAYAFAHRFGVRYVPGTVTVLLDGELVLEATARLGGEVAEASLMAEAEGEGRAYLLRWTFDTPE